MKDIDLNEIVELSNESKKELDFRVYISLIKHYWKWILLSLIVTLIFAFIYIRYATPVYNINSSVILKEKKGGFSSSYDISTIAGVDLTGGVNNVDNEIEVMRSKTIIDGVVKNLQLYISYVVKGRIKDKELYTASPLLFSMSEEELDKIVEPIKLKAEIAKDNSVKITKTVGDKVTATIIKQLPALYSVGDSKVTVSFRQNIKPVYDIPIYITIQNPAYAAGVIRSNLSIGLMANTTSVLNLGYKTTHITKGIDILNTLVQVYNRDAIADRTKEALNTKDFIDERILLIDRELGDAERTVEAYKQRQGLTDLKSNTALSLQKSSQYEQKLVELETQLKLVDYLDNYVRDNANAIKMIPGNIGIDDPTLIATIAEYNKLVLEKERLARTTAESNPVMIALKGQIDGLRSNINSTINTVVQGLNIAIRDAQRQLNQYNSRIGAAPTQERQFTEIVRQQQIKSTLYLMLLQKREENALALAATANSAKVLDEALYTGVVFPKSKLIYLLAFLLGLFIPVSIIVLVELLRNKIQNRSDVEQLTQLPILGDIPIFKDSQIAVRENSNEAVDEAFRIIRTNLLYVVGREKKVIMVTSTESGEGKSFVALNMALSLAFLNKKVLLLGLDLRLPKLGDYLQVFTKQGMTDYLSGLETDINKLIVSSDIHDNLDVMLAGKIPPNPTELLSREMLDSLILDLKDKYDYIIIDSTPASMVTDTLIANRIADSTVYVCRADYSRKDNIRYVDELAKNNRLKDVCIILNAVSEFHQGYGYGYGYGYSYGKKKR